MTKYKKYIGYLLIFLGLIIVVIVLYKNSEYSRINRTFSSKDMLTSSWEKYKNQFIQNGRVIDFSANNITTSEGQSYGMLRSVWIDDKSEFDSLWSWTEKNMKRPNDNLFGWKWGKTGSGYGFIENGGINSASDADTDIALALIFASKRWNDANYMSQAKNILNSLWTLDTATVSGKMYVTGGNWAKTNGQVIINPSYFAPYAWRIFAKVDPRHDWNSLVGPAYDLLNKSGQANLGGKTGIGLPPDWLALDSSGNIVTPVEGNLDSNYSFDAMRVPWRIALDYEWNKDKRAYDYLNNNYNKLKYTWKAIHKISGSYTYDGQVLIPAEKPSMYGTALGYFFVTDEPVAKKIYEQKILSLYSSAANDFDKRLPYYDQNWLWFGAGLYNHYLVDLSK